MKSLTCIRIECDRSWDTLEMTESREKLMLWAQPGGLNALAQAVKTWNLDDKVSGVLHNGQRGFRIEWVDNIDLFFEGTVGWADTFVSASKILRRMLLIRQVLCFDWDSLAILEHEDALMRELKRLLARDD